MSKTGVAMVLIRAAEDAKFRESLRANTKEAITGYDICDEEIDYINKVLQRVVEATKEMEQNLFNEMIKPIVPEMPTKFIVALCMGGGGAMSNYNTGCPQSCEFCPQSCEVCDVCPQSCEACPQSCEVVLARASVVNKKPEPKGH